MTHHRRPYSRRLLLAEAALRRLYAGGWPARLWALVPGATRVRRVEHALALPGREPGRPPLRLAFASDLHVGPTTPPALLDRAFALLANARPDVLALGGDYVFLGGTPDRLLELKRRVAAVPAKTKLAVLGNHDWWARPDRMVATLSDAGARVLVNQARRLPAPHDDVALVGLDDPMTGGEAELGEALASVADVPVKIAVCHSPDGFPFLRGSGASLLLCGHTHGGQLALPGYRPIWIPSRWGRRWPFGLHEQDGLRIFVSRGVGGSLVPVRTWAPPDVAVFTLT